MLAWLRTNARPGDLICHTSDSTHVFFDFYFPGRAAKVGDVDTEQCAWLLDERYIVTDPDVAARADQLINERHAELAMHVLENPVIKTDLYRLH